MKTETQYREEMVDALIHSGDLRSDPVRQAFLKVRRDRFVSKYFSLATSAEGEPVWTSVAADLPSSSPAFLASVYENQTLVTALEGPLPAGSLSQPSLVAQMLETLDIQPGMRVLEIGTCSGYNAALLAELVRKTGAVVSIENRADAAAAAEQALTHEGYENVVVLFRDGFYGAAGHPPFDRLVSTAGCPDVSPPWLRQLRPEGKMLVPLQHGQMDYLVLLHPDRDAPDCCAGQVVGCAGFMPLEGTLSWANPWRCLIPPGHSLVEFWRKPLPSNLPPGPAAGDPLKIRAHADFHFYLCLVSRELWQTDRCYGIADLSTGTRVTFSHDSVAAVGPAMPQARQSADCLFRKLMEILEQWDSLGRPPAREYRIRLVPKRRFHDPGLSLADTRWIVERVFHMELIAL
jgi:protein-L-isoaspartate(D-aspartate) O-methyltransferase